MEENIPCDDHFYRSPLSNQEAFNVLSFGLASERNTRALQLVGVCIIRFNSVQQAPVGLPYAPLDQDGRRPEDWQKLTARGAAQAEGITRVARHSLLRQWFGTTSCRAFVLLSTRRRP